jgi:hypothetical protein
MLLQNPGFSISNKRLINFPGSIPGGGAIMVFSVQSPKLKTSVETLAGGLALLDEYQDYQHHPYSCQDAPLNNQRLEEDGG